MSFELEVVLTCPNSGNLRTVRSSGGDTIAEVVDKSGLLELVDPDTVPKLGYGVYGELRLPDDPVYSGDRVEIYRPLTVDPKTARRKRAKQSNVKSRGAGSQD